VRLLLGADQACRFHEWRAFREVIALAEPVVVPRTPWCDAEALAAGLSATGAWTPDEIAAWRRRFVPVPVVDASATSVREALHESPRPEATVRRVLRPAVLDYIERHGLYPAAPR
jgi:nicotinic acid mononucleotide adenylyltransferase